MQSILNDCHKTLVKTTPISLKHPYHAIKKLYHVRELQDMISELKGDVIKAQTEFQVSSHQPTNDQAHKRNDRGLHC
jgi:hypothetical protein